MQALAASLVVGCTTFAFVLVTRRPWPAASLGLRGLLDASLARALAGAAAFVAAGVSLRRVPGGSSSNVEFRRFADAFGGADLP